MIVHTPVFIISVFRTDRSEELNMDYHRSLNEQLKHQGFDFGEVSWCYKEDSADEKAFLVLCPEEDNFADTLYHLIRYARRYGQDSILHVDANSRAQLLFTDWTKDPEALGYFRGVPAAAAQQEESWVRDSLNNHFICRNY